MMVRHRTALMEIAVVTMVVQPVSPASISSPLQKVATSIQ